MAKKFTKEYMTYRKKYYAEKRINNIKLGTKPGTNRKYVSLLTPEEFKIVRKEGVTITQIIRSQTVIGTKAEKKEILRQYNKIKKTYSRGETVFHEKTYFGGQRESVEGLSYHYNLSGLLKDKHAIHFIISHRINNGEDRIKVLSDYGY